MNFDKDDLEWISLNGGHQGVYLKCFQQTSLRNTMYIKPEIIDECLKFNMTNYYINMKKFEDYDDDGKTSQRFMDVTDDTRLTLKQLMKDCEEVRNYVKVQAPEFVV